MKTLILVLSLLLGTGIMLKGQHGPINYDSEKKYYTVPITTAKEIGIMYPYQIAYRWEYTYINPLNGKIVKGYSTKVGEDNNTFIHPQQLIEIKVFVTSFKRNDDYITGLIYHEYHWYQKSFDIDILDTIRIESLEIKN